MRMFEIIAQSDKERPRSDDSLSSKPLEDGQFACAVAEYVGIDAHVLKQ